MKIITIIGARPQFIKSAVVSRAIRQNYFDSIEEFIIHTGQHYDNNMSDIFFDELDIPKPSYHLGIGGGTHGHNTGKMLEAIETLLLKEKPDFVLVYGDTDSTLAGAISAAKIHIPIAHVEAGLRSFNRKMPEELNRVLTDHCSDLLFTPTDRATENLICEGIAGDKVQQVGDVMYDAALFYRSRAKRPKQINIEAPFILSTIHRAENTDDIERLTSIMSALNEIACEIPVVLPIHPRTKKALKASSIDVRNISVIDPVGYLEMVWLLENCNLVITDSGGLQKEAYFMQKPCVTTRNETEWVELVEVGANILVGADPGLIKNAVLKPPILDGYLELYGVGNAGKLISDKLVSILR